EYRIAQQRIKSNRNELSPIYRLIDYLAGESLYESSLSSYGSPYTLMENIWGNYQPILDSYIQDLKAFQCPGFEEEDNSYNAIRYSYSFSKAYDHHSLNDFRLSPSQLGAIVDGTASAFVDSTSRAAQIMARHNLGLNVGHLDGHVEWKGVEVFNRLECQWEVLGMTPHWPYYESGPILTRSTQGWLKDGAVSIP
ncbi:MAG: hypothetical protein HQL32_16315, partial [Planctomycetes bacterium]|nr:hypothetical protein [Planctomycetota bacterium]